ncbi:MAG: hypothetical protein EA360_03350 [Balneolaceae bacterium]|nr:MAG: hypothetical protein EA360_03350 [Balneolaceae bacterium]
MSAIGNIFLQNNPYERFVQQLVQIESRTKLLLQSQKSAQNEKKTALGQVSSSISRFVSKIEELQSPLNKSFEPLAASSSDSSVVTVTSSAGMKKPASYNITINRLAKNDLVLSEVMNKEGLQLAALGEGTVEITIGDRTEVITVPTTYEDENGVIQQIRNGAILKEFAEKISELFPSEIRADSFNTTGDLVQFSMQSLESGYDNRIQFANATGALAGILDNHNRPTAVENLNAQFTIDGVNFERGSNTVDDAIEGLTFGLKKATGEQETMTVSRDISKARANVNSFISAFNDMNRTIRDRTFLDATGNRRGALQDERSIRNLTINLRQAAMLPMDGVADGDIARLSELGISFKNDGTMFVDDADMLTDALTNRAEDVARFFTDENSVISGMKNQAEAYTKRSGGIINSIESGIKNRIERLDLRIAAQDRYLQRYEKEQRETFNKLMAIIEQGDAQYERVMNYRRSVGF